MNSGSKHVLGLGSGNADCVWGTHKMNVERAFCRKGNEMIEPGVKGRSEIVVTENLTARAIGSGELDVYATPAMIALIEETAWKSVTAYLRPGEGTVGTKLDISHVSATPIGQKVTCETEVIEVDRRRIVFQATVSDGCGLIGEGVHERFVVENERFIRKALQKGKND